jgi:hypothetical protein
MIVSSGSEHQRYRFVEHYVNFVRQSDAAARHLVTRYTAPSVSAPVDDSGAVDFADADAPFPPPMAATAGGGASVEAARRAAAPLLELTAHDEVWTGRYVVEMQPLAVTWEDTMPNGDEPHYIVDQDRVARAEYQITLRLTRLI